MRRGTDPGWDRYKQSVARSRSFAVLVLLLLVLATWLALETRWGWVAGLCALGVGVAWLIRRRPSVP